MKRVTWALNVTHNYVSLVSPLVKSLDNVLALKNS